MARDYVPITTHASGDAASRARAREMLERVVRRASPIMQRRQLRVQALVEMPPPREVTIWGDNLNHGARIRLVLRVRVDEGKRSRSRRSSAAGATAYRWIADDEVFATFLHELAHNERGPHDAKFYAILNEMTIQAEMHMASNLYVCGRCVGGGDGGGGVAVWRSPRRAAADAALRRSARAHPPRRRESDHQNARRRPNNIPAREAAAIAAAMRASTIVIISDGDEDEDEDEDKENDRDVVGARTKSAHDETDVVVIE